MVEDSGFKNDDGIALSEEETKEVKRLEDKKKAKQKGVLDSKDKIFGAAHMASHFIKANLSGVNFENANLINTRMLALNLFKTINLNPEQVELAELDRATQLPPYFEINWKGKEENTRLKNDCKNNKT